MSVKKESLFKQKLKQAKIEKEQGQKTNQKEPQQVQSFPKVFKIDNFEINNESDYKSAEQQRSESINEPMVDQKMQEATGFEEMTYLIKHKETLNNLISEDELNQINNQNWNAVNSMNEEERSNYVNLIENTLPAHFIEKLKKNKQQKTNKQSNKISYPIQMIPEIAKLNPNNPLKTQQIKDIPQQIEQMKQGNDQKDDIQDQTQNHKAIIANIHLNIKTGKLSYLHDNVHMTLTQEEKNSFVNFDKIYEMLTSDNNQSLIIAAQLTLDWVKNIFPTQNIVFFIDTIPFHSRIMIAQIYSLLKPIETHLKSTKFYSCYVQLLVKSVQILTCIFKCLSDSQLQEQIKFSQIQFEKSQKSLKDFIHQNDKKDTQQFQQPGHKQSKQMLFESLGILYQSLNEEKTSRAETLKNSRQLIQIEQKLQKLKNSSQINDLIEAFLIEQTLKKQEFQQYELYPSINCFLQTITDFWSCKIQTNLQNLSEKLPQARDFYDVSYALVCKLSKKKRAFPFYSPLIEKIFEGLLQILESQYLKGVLEEILSKNFADKLSLKKNKNLNTMKSSITFKILHIYRELSGKTDKLGSFLQSSKLRGVMSEQETSIMVYINLSHYLEANDLKAQEIEMLQKMFKWIKVQLMNRKSKQALYGLDSQQILLSVLGLFLSSEQEVYSLIDQTLLNDVFRLTIEFYESQVNKGNKGSQSSVQQILSEQQIKRMIQNYNYNSFGNDIFTKVIFWVAVSINPQTQALITEEVMMRYPMLFYYASQPQIPNNQNMQNSPSIKNIAHQNPLLGNPSHYLKTDPKSKEHYFTYKSNQQIKANLLKLLFLNLDFSSTKTIDYESIKRIIGQQTVEQTRGFHIKKAKINEDNYLYRYLIQPFLKVEEYKQLF